MRIKHAHLASHVRQLCSLGLQPVVVVPHIVEAVRRIVGADWGMFYFAGAQGSVADLYSQNTDIFALLPRFLSERGQAPERDIFGIDFETCMARGRSWENTARYDTRLLSTSVYDEMWKPIGMRHSVEITAVDSASGRGLGCLQLSRDQTGRAFTDDERSAITALSRHIAHALNAPALPTPGYARRADAATILIDQSGRLAYKDHDAGRLLALADGRPTMSDALGPLVLPTWLTPVLHRLRGIYEERAELPPKIERINAAGRFVFRAYRLQDIGARSDAGLIAVLIRHYVPAQLAAEANAFALGLSAQQRRVSARFVLGYSQRDIGAALGIGDSTVADHLRRIYEVVGVHSREELKAVLL